MFEARFLSAFARRHRRRLRNESLEDRLLLAVTVLDQIDPSEGLPWHIAPTSSTYALSNSVAEQIFQFSFDAPQPSVNATFSSQANAFTDGAIAIYDRDGNLIRKADADSDPSSHANEYLELELKSRTEYLLSVVSNPSIPAELTLQVSVESKSDTPIAISPSDGLASFSAGNSDDVLLERTDVNLHPIKLLNAGETATLTVTPDSSDLAIHATVFRFDNIHETWRVVATETGVAAGESIELSVTPEANRHLTDSDYLLAVSPLDFDSAGGDYTVDIKAGLLGPDSINLPPSTQFLVDDFKAVGTLGADLQAVVSPNSPLVTTFRAAESGQASIQVSSTSVAPMVTVYDESGAFPIVVASRKLPPAFTEPIEFSFDVEASQGYVVRVGSVGETQGNLDLSIDTSYTPIAVAPAAPFAQSSILGVTLESASDVGLFRVDSMPGNIFVVEINPSDPSSPNPTVPLISVIDSQLSTPVTSDVGTDGQHLFALDVTGHVGPVDIMVRASSGIDPFDITLGTALVPSELDLGAFAGEELNLDGSLASQVGLEGFGTASGIAFYNLVSEAIGATQITAQSQVPTAIAVYEEYGGAFELVDWSLPSNQNPLLEREIRPNQHHGIAVIPLTANTIDVATIDIQGPAQTGIGVGMVPSDGVIQPSAAAERFGRNQNGEYVNPFPEADSWAAELNIVDVVLENEYEQHLWRTVLPLNSLAGAPLTLQLAPENQAGLTVEVLDPVSDPPQTIGTITSINGATETTQIPANNYQVGQSLLFRVRSLPDQLDDGTYTLNLAVDTSNPHPFEVTERHWRFIGPELHAVDDPYSDFQQGTPPADNCEVLNVIHCAPTATTPVGVPVEIALSQWGQGTATGFLGEQRNGVPDLVDVYRVHVPASGRFRVWTEAIDETINTNLRVYKRIQVPLQNETFDGLAPLAVIDDGNDGELVEVLPNFDWFPADRSEIDAQSLIQDLKVFLDSTDESIYIVVKNQEASEGQYRIHVETSAGPPRTFFTALVEMPSTGPGEVSRSLLVDSLPERPLRYTPIQLPDDHHGQLRIQARAGVGQWDVRLFDDQGEEIEADSLTGQFDVRRGPQTVFARLHATALPADVESMTFDVSIAVESSPRAAPPAFVPDGAFSPLDVNQFGDATVEAQTASTRTGQKFYLPVAGGPLRVKVAPHDDARFRFAIYVDGQLQTWDETEYVNGQPLEESLWTEASLGGGLPTFSSLATTELSNAVATRAADQSMDSRDMAFLGKIGEVTDYHDVVVYVQAIGDAGEFDLAIDSAALKPMRSHELTIDPRNVATSRLTAAGEIYSTGFEKLIDPPTVAGEHWNRLFVPDGATNVNLRVSRHDFLSPTSTFRYSVFNVDGELMAGGERSIPFVGDPSVSIQLPSSIHGGKSYYVRIAPTLDPLEFLRLNATATASNGRGVPLDELPVPSTFPNSITLNPAGDGEITAVEPLFPFWVGDVGDVTIVAEANGGLDDLQLYRIHRYLLNETTLVNELVLVDYANKSAVRNLSQLSLAAYLDPGAYAIRTDSAADKPVTIRLDTPTPIMDEIVLDPNFGISQLPGLSIRANGKTTFAAVGGSNFNEAATNLQPEFRQSFYRVTIPGGALGPGSAAAEALETGRIQPFQRDDLAFFGWWREDETDQLSYRADPNRFFLNPIVNNNDELQGQQAEVTAKTPVAPHETLYLSLNRLNLDSSIDVSAIFPVPFSGTPDLVVLPILLSANQGETRVGINVTNMGYAPAFPSTAHYRIRNAAIPAPSLQWVTAELVTSTLGPFGSSLRALEWDPVTPSDEVEYIADVDDQIEELSETNNSAGEFMNTVNEYVPAVDFFGLLNSSLDGMHGPILDPNDDTWGRYIEGVPGIDTKLRFQVSDADDLKPDRYDIYQSVLITAAGTKHTFGSLHEYSHPFEPRKLDPTSGNNPNEYSLYARDIWGLESETVIRKAYVVPRPKWLTSDSPSVSANLFFDSNTSAYRLEFENRLIDYEKTLNQLLGVNVPFVGSKTNQFFVGISTETPVSLNPQVPINPPIRGEVVLKLLGSTVMDVTYDGNGQVTDQVAILADLEIDPDSVEATKFIARLRLDEIPVLEQSLPEIKLFSYGVPGIASLNANLIIGVLADLRAGVSVALDAGLLTGGSPSLLGVARPTFVGIDVNPSLTIEGEAELFGFLDIASLSGSLGLNLEIDFGLSNDGSSPTDVVAFGDFFSESSVGLSASLTIGVSAAILGAKVWGYEWESPPLFSVGDVYTWEDYDQDTGGGGVAASIPDPQTMTQDDNGNPIPVPPPPQLDAPAVGDQPLGTLLMRAQPQLVLDGDDGFFIQSVDVGNGRTNLAFAQRSATVWDSNLTTLSQAEHVMNPDLVILNHGRGKAGVVAYQATALPDVFSPNVTFDAFLNSQEIRYRYFDGVSWSQEKVVETNGQYDAHPTISFNGSGQGALTWVHNSSDSPLRSPLTNEIHASIWDESNQTWSPPIAITNDVVGSLASDTSPSVHFSEDGTATIVWLRNDDVSHPSAAGNQIWFSRWNGENWSPAAMLPVTGLTSAKVSQIVIGSSGRDQQDRERIDIVFAAVDYADEDGDASTTEDAIAISRLLHRTTPLEHLTSPTPAQIISENANYSYLDFANDPNTGMSVYWQQSDGRTNDIYVASLNDPKSPRWTESIRLTHGDTLEIAPALAIDDTSREGSRIQLVFDQTLPIGSSDTIPPAPNDASDGIPLAGHVSGERVTTLPELDFVRPFRFVATDAAVIGSTIEGHATIVNRGLAPTDVRVEFVRLEDNAILATRNLRLSTGSQYDIVQSMPVQPGGQTIEARLTAVSTGGLEMTSLENNTSADTVFGAVDLIIDSITLPSSYTAGQNVNVDVTIRNPSERNVDTPFDVSLFAGSQPLLPLPGNALLSQKVNSLPANQSTTLSFAWTVPSDGGTHGLTAMIDTRHVIPEAFEFNNLHTVAAMMHTDIDISPVALALIDYSGTDNVEISTRLQNRGNLIAKDFIANLWWQRNDQVFELKQSTDPLTLAIGETTSLAFVEDGLAGKNTYRISIDPLSTPHESSRRNDSRRDSITLQGFADLTVVDARIPTEEPMQGKSAQIEIVVENQGIEDAHHVQIEVFALVPGHGRAKVAAGVINHLAPHTNTIIQLDLDTSDLEGEVEFQVMIDRHQKILEVTDLNNTFALLQSFLPLRSFEQCDLNRDGSCSAEDIDELFAKIRNGVFISDFDVNDDGVLDRKDSNFWIEDLMMTTPGDANLDRVFNSTDFIQVFTRGEYEDDFVGNSTFADGDWNGDGDFTSSDLVFAFQRSGYQRNAFRDE